ncbi:MAG: DUF2269 domain-containing protein [Candidatus Competibacter sp.]|nr:DUF2269 domain-containing protein [Candidatus Competibacter sp.]
MNVYLLVKTLHVLSSVLLVGTGFGTAYYLFFANRSGSVAALAVVARLVVRADWWFTAPTVIVQPVSGWWLARAAGWSWDTPWLLLSVLFYGLAGGCWLPVVWLQIRLEQMAQQAAAKGEALPERYWRYARYWQRLGYPAFGAMVAIYFLMVFKPAL